MTHQHDGHDQIVHARVVAVPAAGAEPRKHAPPQHAARVQQALEHGRVAGARRAEVQGLEADGRAGRPPAASAHAAAGIVHHWE